MRTPLLQNYVEDANGCRLYQGYIHANGYGWAHIPGAGSKNSSDWVHRIFWRNQHGPIPEGMTIHHKCEVKRCVNVLHLELVGRIENIQLSAGRPRFHHGLQRPMPPGVVHGKPATYA